MSEKELVLPFPGHIVLLYGFLLLTEKKRKRDKGGEEGEKEQWG